METEFNLLDEKWILVRKSDCTTDELSLTDALLRSHEYTALSGENIVGRRQVPGKADSGVSGITA